MKDNLSNETKHKIEEAELRARHIVNEHCNLNEMIDQRVFIIGVGKISEKLGFPTYMVNFGDDFGVEKSRLTDRFTNDVKGFAMKNTKSAASGSIYVDSRDDIEVRRFTAAHELGHLILKHLDDSEMSIAFRDNASAPDQADEKELTANAFAAELLMPKRLMKEALRNKKITKAITIEDMDFIPRLAESFGVTVEAMRRQISRLRELGEI